MTSYKTMLKEIELLEQQLKGGAGSGNFGHGGRPGKRGGSAPGKGGGGSAHSKGGELTIMSPKSHFGRFFQSSGNVGKYKVDWGGKTYPMNSKMPRGNVEIIQNPDGSVGVELSDLPKLDFPNKEKLEAFLKSNVEPVLAKDRNKPIEQPKAVARIVDGFDVPLKNKTHWASLRRSDSPDNNWKITLIPKSGGRGFTYSRLFNSKEESDKFWVEQIRPITATPSGM